MTDEIRKKIADAFSVDGTEEQIAEAAQRIEDAEWGYSLAEEQIEALEGAVDPLSEKIDRLVKTLLDVKECLEDDELQLPFDQDDCKILIAEINETLDTLKPNK